MSTPIPQPKRIPFLGNVTDVDPRNSIESFKHLYNKYGPIYKLTFLGQDNLIVCNVAMMSELCDEKRFHKSVSGPLKELRAVAADGLFTAHTHEHNWELAHRILVPAFGPLGIQNMFDEMFDIGSQLVSKWARSTEKIDVTLDFTRLTLDSIALCAMDTRFNSFYTEKAHPFVDAMMSVLSESALRDMRTKFEKMIRRNSARRFQQNIDYMQKLSMDLVRNRREHPSDKKDLLNAMINGVDPKTGEHLDDKTIINNMITFLVAGHETTSGLLSFTMYYLLKNPHTLEKARAEVDQVTQGKTVKYEHMSKLPYIEAVLRETLRLCPTAPGFTVETNSKEPEILGGKYLVQPGVPINVILPIAGCDKDAFGPDADEFKPERLYKENFDRIPANSWKPFGNGVRGCIGRPFAWQESLLILCLILQNFDLRMDNPSYKLSIKETLTLKPDGFYIRASLRHGIDPIKFERKLYGSAEEEEKKQLPQGRVKSTSTVRKPITVAYGSNSGTCEALAHSFASNASTYGYVANIRTMDSFVDGKQTQEPLVIITASYEGQPPDNAASFVSWIENKSTQLDGLQYAVFGCGHHDWTTTFQRVPKLVDTRLAEIGGTRIAERGECDVALGKIFDDFDHWQDEVLWPKLAGEKIIDEPDPIDIRISTTARASQLKYALQEALVVENRLLTKDTPQEKRHVALRLPTSMTYTAGDYLAVLPMNDEKLVSKILQHFDLPWDAVMTLKDGSQSFLPINKEIPVSTVLQSYVELNNPATKKHIAMMSEFADDPAIKESLLSSNVATEDSLSVFEILQKFPSIKLPFRVFASTLPRMRIRQYSISSSPLVDPNVASITFSVANQDKSRPGVATNYLKSLEPGSRIQVMVKKSPTAFHLPHDDSKPIIMACAGSGLAPFRGFVQERVAKLEAVKPHLGPALLFIGCRDPDKDSLYADELEHAERTGAVKVFYAFSQKTEKSEGCKYVQDRLWQQRAPIKELFDQGAQVYICGSSAVGKGVQDKATQLVVEVDAQNGETTTPEEALEWWQGLKNERYAVDVFD